MRRAAAPVMTTFQILAEPERKPMELAARCQQAQLEFLAAVGQVTVDVNPLHDILSTNDTELLSCALGQALTQTPYSPSVIRISRKTNGTT